MEAGKDTEMIRRLEAEIARLRAELAARDAAIAELSETADRLRTTEAALRRHEEDMRAILDNLPSMIGYWDATQHNRFANHAYTKWFGIDYRTIPGKHIREVIGEERYRLNFPYIEGALRGEEQMFERAIPSPDGKFVRHSLAHYIPDVIDGKVRGFFVLVSDVTALKDMEGRLRDANEELEQFAYAASHDLREPLRMIGSYMGLLERRYRDKLGQDALEFIEYARDGARRLDRMILELLDFSRIGRMSDPFEPLALDEVVAIAIGNLGMATADADARIEVGEGLGVVDGSRNELVRLFQNLLGNALKYRQPGRPAQISVTAKRDGGEITIAVADNGIGIPAEFTERIFNIFQRLHTRDQYEGTGIGLAICRKIVQHHGGRITVESEVGKGSTFLVTLPAAPAE